MTIANKSDLVKRLTVEHSDTTRQQLFDLCHDAADEIEQLRILVREGADECIERDAEIEHLRAHRESLFAIIARQALEIAQLRREQ